MSRNSGMLSIGVAIPSITIIVRGCYRSVELAEGWGRYLVNTESYLRKCPYFVFVLTDTDASVLVQSVWTLQ